MELYKKFNGGGITLIPADKIYTHKVKEIQDGKESERSEGTWIFYNNSFNKIVDFQDGLPVTPVFSFYKGTLSVVISDPDNINIVTYKNYYNITSDVSDIDVNEETSISQMWEHAVRKVGIKNIMSHEPPIDSKFDVICDFGTYMLLITRYMTKPIIIKKGDNIHVLGMLVYDKDEGVSTCLTEEQKKTETQIIKHIRSDVYRHSEQYKNLMDMRQQMEAIRLTENEQNATSSEAISEHPIVQEANQHLESSKEAQ